MATTRVTPADVVLPSPRWWERETRIGRHLYPLRAIAVAMGAGAVTAVVGVLAVVALLAD